MLSGVLADGLEKGKKRVQEVGAHEEWRQHWAAGKGKVPHPAPRGSSWPRGTSRKGPSALLRSHLAGLPLPAFIRAPATEHMEAPVYLQVPGH